MNANIEPELNSLLTKLTAEIQQDQNEVLVRQNRIQKNEALLKAVRGSLIALHPEMKREVYGSKNQMVKDAISRITSPRFTQDNVESEMRSINPDADIDRDRIRAVLWTLASKKQLIRQVSKGNNNQPAEYEKLNGVSRLSPPPRRVPARIPTPASNAE